MAPDGGASHEQVNPGLSCSFHFLAGSWHSPNRPRRRRAPVLRFVAGSTVKMEQLLGEMDKEKHQPTLSLTETRYGIRGNSSIIQTAIRPTGSPGLSSAKARWIQKPCTVEHTLHTSWSDGRNCRAPS